MRLYHEFNCLLTGAMLLFQASVYAQQRDTILQHQLAPVEVNAKAMPSVSKSTSPLQRLDREEIDQLGIQSLTDAVRRFAGVSVKDYGGIGGLKTVSIRGFGAQHTAVTYDGVAVSDIQSGQIDIGRFSLENVSTLSVTTGQSDDIFQPARSFASVGVLNIETQVPSFDQKKQAGTAQIRTGSFGQFAPYLSFTQQLNQMFTYSANGEWQRADGNYPFDFNNGAEIEHRKRLNSDVDIRRTEVNLYGSFGQGGDLRVKGNYFYSDRGLPGNVVSYNTDADDRLKDEDLSIQASYKNKINDQISLKGNLRMARAHSFYKDFGAYAGGYVDNIYNQKEYYTSLGVLYHPSTNLSISFVQDLSHNGLTINYSDQDPKRVTSLSAMQTKYESKRLIIMAGLLGTYSHEWVKEGENADDKKRLSPAFSTSYQPFETFNLRIRGSYKDIYRLPTFNDLYYFRIGNTNLRPEIAHQYNVGMTWIGRLSQAIDYVHFSADIYYNKVKDKIIAISPALFVWKMKNAAKADVKGLDLNLTTNLNVSEKASLHFNAVYSYQSAIDLSDKNAKNYKGQVPYTPKHSGNGSVTLRTPLFNVSYSIIASGIRYSLPENIKQNELNAYWDHSVSINRTFAFPRGNALRFQADFLNLADQNYEIIQSYPMPGRSFRATVSWVY